MRWLLLFLAASSFASEPANTIRKLWFVNDPLPALDARTHSKFEPAPGVVAERISYTTQFGMRVPAILYRPAKPATQAPGLIVVNGHGGDKYSWYAMYTGMLYARAGAFVLTYDPTGEGERNTERRSGTREHDKVEAMPELGQRIAGLMMTDILQAVSYLSQRPEVDASRIGAMGYSMGSFILGVTCAVETRLKACVLVGGGNLDGPDGYWDNSKPMCQGYPYKALEAIGDRPLAIYEAHARRGPTLIYNGDEDTTVAIPKFGAAYFEQLRRRIRGPLPFDVMFNHGTGHRPYFVTRPVALWLEQHLDFPSWTPDSISTMRTTTIGQWAKENGVDMDPLYATEHREGGTPALGEGLPGLKRSDLHVFAEDEWTAHKDELVHSGWRRRAKERMEQ